MQGGVNNVAVLITCHNRRELTLQCLEKLFSQKSKHLLTVFLVDDGCTDGTPQAVSIAWPEVQIVTGSGNLFWNGGMRAAWHAAKTQRDDWDAYLWLNDDVSLHETALDKALSELSDLLANSSDQALILVGPTTDTDGGKATYGGLTLPKPRERPLRMVLTEPVGSPSLCDTFSGNFVLISRRAEQMLGSLREDFIHIYGDLDYGFRARDLGIPIYQMSDFVGTCSANSSSGSSLDRTLSLFKRLSLRIKEEKKLHARDWRKFCRLHSKIGPLYFLYSIPPYLRIIATSNRIF